jgi:16S rRNA (cytosine1402-N4)-methyltransferase
MSEHIPVLVREVIELLQPKPGHTLLDATLGHGGHAKAFLEAAGDDSTVIGIDADAAALAVARQTLAQYGDRVQFQEGNFLTLPDVTVDAILFDLGIGSHQLSDEERGFSFTSSGPLSMKYGTHETLPPSRIAAINDLTQKLQRYPDADDLVNRLSPIALSEVIQMYGEERFAGVAANAIAGARPIVDAATLAKLLQGALPKFYEKGRIHPATRTFQALRLAVNRELEVLERVLPQAVERLRTGGVIAVISFHSLEDRIVKRYMRQEAKGCICPPQQVVCICGHTPRIEILTKRPVIASEEEKQTNPRSRSAKLRAARKT